MADAHFMRIQQCSTRERIEPGIREERVGARLGRGGVDYSHQRSPSSAAWLDSPPLTGGTANVCPPTVTVAPP